jgi:hypothetical protein
MKTIGSHNIRGGNIALIIGGIFLVFLGVTATVSTGLGTSSLTIIGIPISNILMIILGFFLILLALRANVSKAVVKSGS